MCLLPAAVPNYIRLGGWGRMADEGSLLAFFQFFGLFLVPGLEMTD